MSIKVIKHGKKPFPRNCTCPECQCEFTYELEDLKTDYDICYMSYPVQYRRYVICPDCGKRIFVDTVRDNISIGSTGIPSINYTYSGTKGAGTTLRDCVTCPHNGGPKDIHGNPVAGDSMCDWCPNKSLYVGK